MPDKRQCVVVMGIVRKGDKILLTQRYEKEVEGAHMKWELPGGKLEFGETPEETVIREIKEETGYNIRVIDMIPLTKMSVWDYPDHKKHVLLLCFNCEIISGDINKKDKKINDIKWFNINDIDSMDTLQWTREFVENSIRK